MNGIDISKGDFSSLKGREQMSILFQNTERIIELQEQLQEKFRSHEKKDFTFYIMTIASISLLSIVLGVKLEWVSIPWL